MSKEVDKVERGNSVSYKADGIYDVVEDVIYYKDGSQDLSIISEIKRMSDKDKIAELEARILALEEK